MNEGNKMKDPLLRMEEMLKKVEAKRKERSESVFGRYPYAFSLLVTIGFLSVLYGFENLVNEWDFMAERPWLVLVVGLIILISTGRLYKRLGVSRD